MQIDPGHAPQQKKETPASPPWAGPERAGWRERKKEHMRFQSISRKGAMSPVTGTRRVWRMSVVLTGAAMVVASMGVPTASASSTPSGERVVGRTVVEPTYDSMTGAIRYLSTPMGAPDPVKSNPIASAPIYVPVYPVGSTVGTLLCAHDPATNSDNCPDHGPGIAGAAAAIMPGVYGNGVIGHDHLMAGPASHGDFNVAWEPILVLFTSKTAANRHLILESDVEAAVHDGRAIEIHLPQLTFTCAVVNQAVYARGTPLS